MILVFCICSVTILLQCDICSKSYLCVFVWVCVYFGGGGGGDVGEEGINRFISFSSTQSIKTNYLNTNSKYVLIIKWRNHGKHNLRLVESDPFKGQVSRSRIIIFSKERENFPLQNGAKIFRHRIEIRTSYDILKFHILSENISWPVLINIQMSVLMMSSAHNFLHISL